MTTIQVVRQISRLRNRHRVLGRIIAALEEYERNYGKRKGSHGAVPRVSTEAG